MLLQVSRWQKGMKTGSGKIPRNEQKIPDMSKGDPVHSKKQGAQGAGGVVGRIAPASKLHKKRKNNQET